LAPFLGPIASHCQSIYGGGHKRSEYNVSAVRLTPVTALARRLGPFDATMIVMGGIIGSGIFINPYVVARQVHTPALIVGAWAAGGVIALLGAFVYAELAALRPEVGGQYAYLRDAYHPAVAFLYGWALLLVMQTGGMAAVAATFGKYFAELTGSRIGEAPIAVIALVLLTIINCLGVRGGSNTQSALMLLKLAAIAALIVAGFSFRVGRPPSTAAGTGHDTLLGFGAAMTPVMFAYGGWQTASFISGELKRPRRDLAIGLLLGVTGVIAVYVLVNIVCVRVLGPAGLAATTTPASAVMRSVLGERGAKLIAVGIAISTLGFLSQSMLTAPRVYYAMAADGVFFRQVAHISPRTQVPVVAIILQGAVAIAITLSGTYEEILSYVVSVDFIFFGLTGMALFVFRRHLPPAPFRTPGHPVSTAVFVAACWAVVIATIARSPLDSAIGLAILAAGLPAYALWVRGRSGGSVRLPPC
jgi:basic amino acid/polyamine antiporter, APA family